MPFTSTACTQARLNQISDSNYIINPLAIGATYKNINHGSDIYGRYYNPNAGQIEELFKKIYSTENMTVEHCHALSSGMGALLPLIFSTQEMNECFLGEIVVDENIYTEIKDIINRVGSKMYPITFLDTNNTEELEKYLSEHKVDLLILDACPSPDFKRSNLREITKIAHNGIYFTPVAVDNTNLSCYCYNPFDDGADIVFESLTKYCCGHGDVSGGILLGRNCETFIKLMGTRMDSFSAWILLRSMSTMGIRMEHIIKKTDSIYQRLEKDFDKIKFVKCAGTIVFQADDDTVNKIRDRIKNCLIIHEDYSFGQDSTNITFQANKIIRISIGLEDENIIYEELKRCLE